MAKDDDMDDCFTISSNDEIFKPYQDRIKRKSFLAPTRKQAKEDGKQNQMDKKKENTVNAVQKNMYCTDWMSKQHGISMTNCDAPPSLYAPSVALSDSLSDVTSVLCNAPPQTSYPKPKLNLGKGINFSTKNENMTFM